MAHEVPAANGSNGRDPSVLAIDGGGTISALPIGELRERFERDGFLVLDDTGCAAEVLDGVITDLDGLYEGGVKRNGVFYSARRIQDAWRISANVRALALSPDIHRILSGLYDRGPLPFQTLNFRSGSEQAVHSDTIHFNSTPPGYMCGVWVALEDIDMENGPLVYYPGSHKLPELTMQDVGATPSADEYPQYERFVSDLIEREGLEPAYGTVRKGQVFIWAANLLHGGLPQRDRQRTRHSQVTHFFFTSCRYFTPMLTGEGHVEWRQPTWITAEDVIDEDGGYDAGRIRATIRARVPEGQTVAIVDGGDEDLVGVEGRNMQHLPRNPDGSPAWHNPADSADVIGQLDRERESGARYLVIPSASLWWLDYYPGLAEHLQRDCRLLVQDSDCALYEI
jgi:hypothetical protein